MPSLIATKPMTYATRRLKAGDPFRANRRDARILRAIGKAADAPARVPQARQAEAAQSPLDTLRLQAGAIGVAVDGRWGEARIQQEIEMRKSSAMAAAEEEKKPVPAEHMPQERGPEQKTPVPAERTPTPEKSEAAPQSEA